MASRTTTDSIEKIPVDLGVDLTSLAFEDSSEQDYLSKLREGLATIEFKSKGNYQKNPKFNEQYRILQEEFLKVRKGKKKPQAKKTKISASAFKRGSATGVNVTPKALPTSAIVPYQKPEAEEVKEEKKEEKKKGSSKNLILEISETVTRIADILKDQYDLKKDTATFDRKKAERERRDLQKKNLAKRFEGLKRVAEKLIAPVRGIFDRIMGFLFNIILGKFLIKLVEWFSNPDNQGKIKSIIRFLTNNWPKLLSAYIVFGTGLGKFSRFLVKILARGAVRLAAATTGLLARLFGARALGKFSRFFGRRGKVIAGGIEAVTTIIAFKALENAFTKGIAPEESASIDNDIPVSGYQGGGLVQPIFKFQGGGPVKFNLLDPRTWFSGKAQQTIGDKTGRYSDDTLSGRLLNRRNATNEAIMKMRGYEEGGEVDGPGGIDKVPAMLTDGEFVMSRGAVQKYGLAQLEAMNAAGGGTNQPKIMNGTVFANTGGSIGGGPMFPEHPSDYRTGSLLTDPLGALDRILGQSSGGKFRLPGGGSKSPDTPPSRPEPKPEPPKSKPKESLAPKPAGYTGDETAGDIPAKMLSSSSFRDVGVSYLRHMLGGLGGALTEQDLSAASKKELNLAIARAKKRHPERLAKATREWNEAKTGEWNKSKDPKGREAYATRKGIYERLKRGEVQVDYIDYYEKPPKGNPKDPNYFAGLMTDDAKNAKSILGKFWAATTAQGGHRVVNERYDFQSLKDPIAVLRNDPKGVSDENKEPVTLKNKLQALSQLNPFSKDMGVDMLLGQPETAQRKMNNIVRKLGGVIDFVMRDTTDFDGMNTKFEKTPAKPQPKAQPKAQQKHNQNLLRHR